MSTELNNIQAIITNCQQIVQQLEESYLLFQINQALVQENFLLYSQPIVPVNSNSELTHQEIFLGFFDQNGNLLTPALFLPVAEKYQLASKLDCYLINKFFSNYQLNSHNQTRNLSSLDNPIYFIPLSATSINNDNFLDFLQAKLIQYQIPPQIVCFQIHETTALAHSLETAHFIQQIKQIKQFGCYFAIDDFGSCLSSLAYLKHLPLDYLKIDCYSRENLTQDTTEPIMLNCFHQIAQFMNMTTIAKSVENLTIFNQLKTLGINYAQGSAIAPPVYSP